MIFSVEPEELDRILYGNPSDDIHNKADMIAVLKNHVRSLDNLYKMCENGEEVYDTDLYDLGDTINLMIELVNYLKQN